MALLPPAVAPSKSGALGDALELTCLKLAQLGATVVPMPGPCGCEIKGIDLAGTEGKLQPEVAGAIEVLMAIHGFVLFRNQVVLGDPSFLSCLFSRLRPCVWHPGP